MEKNPLWPGLGLGLGKPGPPLRRRLSFVLVFLVCSLSPVLAEQFVMSDGKKLVSFDVPWVQHMGTKEGKVTRTTFAEKWDGGKLQITIKVKPWTDVDPEIEYQKERNKKAEVSSVRVRPPDQVPGAAKVLLYTSSKPYNSHVIVLYTEDFRCQFMVTGSGEAKDKMGPTRKQLLKTLRVLPKEER